MTTRRTKGDGGLTLRADGRWQATLALELPNGRKVRKTFYGRTMKEAKAKLDTARRERDAGALVAKSPTVKAWMEGWLEARRRPPKPVKPNTWNGYVSKVNRYIVPALGKKRLSDLRPQHIEAMYDDMRNQGLAESTVRQTHAILGKALNDAVRKGALGRSPMDRVDAPGTETNDRDQFTLIEAGRALNAAGDSARWWLALFYGLRQGECLGLLWEDIDWERRAFRVEQTRQNDYGYGGAVLDDPKSKASKRPLPMLGQIEVRLQLLWDAADRPVSGLVFPGRDSKPQDPKADWTAWRALLDSAEPPLPHIALHAARNSAASLMEAAGIPDRVVMQILGQSTLKVTHRYQTAELERLRQYLGGVTDVLALD